MKRPTIRDVARRAGVVPSTVSRVLNNYPDVADDTRRRVLDAIRQLGFHPNHVARQFRRGRTGSVSVILPRVDTDFYTAVISALDEALDEHSLGIALFPVLSEARLSRYRSEDALPYQSDGLVLISLDPDRLYSGQSLPAALPTVLIDMANPRFDSVFVDNRLGGYLAGKLLCERPAPTFVVLVEEWFSTPFASGVFHERLAGFRAALGEDGVYMAAENIIATEFSWAGGRIAARQILERVRPPLNVFATCDLMARGILDEAKALGLAVGKDIRVVGYDGLAWTEEYGLSTVAQPLDEMGRTGAQLLLERLHSSGHPPTQIRLQPHLVRRASTDGG
ncbi:LacI family DNA-binding transcriptional regulator [Carboxydochorda subterranea]|uniref:LacI family DNA-binding transcriptional regulator n=1 Tax=Carboxydichorda subterranea TaxID=3109565 RepID=A0ABZ1BTE7_9FIRM|nr:LacI family DNA-binding transcriptional regulator [Limnochorda sp. L945t]WRP16052.1 LacI family DNA-binding transcriptional regulator [Limnochorda sp. L945t]